MPGNKADKFIYSVNRKKPIQQEHQALPSINFDLLVKNLHPQTCLTINNISLNPYLHIWNGSVFV